MGGAFEGILIIGVAAVLYLLSLVIKKKARLHHVFSNDSRAENILTSLTDAVEDGGAIHLDSTGMADPSRAVTIELAETIAADNAFSGEPLHAASDNGLITPALQDAIANGMNKSGLENDYSSDSVVFSGFSALSHQAAALTFNGDEAASLHINTGSYGAEAALQSLAYDGYERIVSCGENPTAQSVAFLSGDDALIAEEIFESAGAVTGRKSVNAGLLTMDVLRLAVAVGLIAGAILAFLG